MLKKIICILVLFVTVHSLYSQTYLPLSGGNLSGPLQGTSANFSGDAAASSFYSSSYLATGGFIDIHGLLFHRDNINVLNKAGNGWVTWATRNTANSETVIQLSNLGATSSVGINAGFTTADRSTSSNNWSFYANGGIGAISNNRLGNILSLNYNDGSATFSNSFNVLGSANLKSINNIGDFTSTMSATGGTSNFIASFINQSSNGYGALIKNSNDQNPSLSIVNAANNAYNIVLYGSGDASFAGKLYVGKFDPINTPAQISNYSLAVNGNAIFNKAVIKVYGNWSDYVFNEDYKLMPLDALEKYIKANHHLPEIPSAKEVEKDGIDIGTNQALLLKKIEELTLIIIDLNKKIEKQEKSIANIENKHAN